jgi:hypothetical protein
VTRRPALTADQRTGQRRAACEIIGPHWLGDRRDTVIEGSPSIAIPRGRSSSDATLCANVHSDEGDSDL